MVVEIDDYVLAEKTVFWFYKKGNVPEYAHVVAAIPDGFYVVRNQKNGYPFLKRLKKVESESVRDNESRDF